MQSVRPSLVVAAGAVGIAAIAYGIYFLSRNVDPSISVAAITAATTIIVSTATISVGRYLEKQKELDALHREKKIPIYGKFLDGIFNAFYERRGKKTDMVKFFQEWQEKIVLWGGSEVVNAYIEWKEALAKNEPNVATIESTETLIRAIRKELGHNDSQLMDGIFPRFILRESELYFELSKKNPSLTLQEMSAHEEKLSAKDERES